MKGVRYRIERTSNRHSRAVLRDGVIRIRLARGLPHVEELRHIDSLLRRMTKAAVKEAKKARIDPFGSFLDGERTITLVTGSVVRVHVQAGKRTKAFRTGEGWSVLRDPTISDKAFERFLWKLLAESLREEADALVRKINAKTFGVPITTVTLKYMRSRWGSCAHHGGITLATPLFLTTPEILRYVIIHELAHRIHHDHSPAFWRTVAAHDPDYKEHVKQLRAFTLS